MSYESLLIEAQSEGIEVFERPLIGTLKGLYSDNIICIDKDLENCIEKVCILAEEIGHHHTSTGDILNQQDVRNRKQELRARQWAYEKLIPLSAIVEVRQAKVNGRHEIADFLGVTEEFLQATIDRYRDKYGLIAGYQNYVIFLDPLWVVKVE
ncbi:ImmA/IrrE family metallo-endopeptidase [Paenibacillus solani]|uniref:ImmA/IrrE family metallo-endopeptidase n=1 Tax=Paenibacillus solani TaxID=1705565 RepID=UPI003D281846